MQRPRLGLSGLCCPLAAFLQGLCPLSPGALNTVLAPLKARVKGSFLFHLDPHSTCLYFSAVYAVAGVSLVGMQRSGLGMAGLAYSQVPSLYLSRSSAQHKGYKTLSD